MPIICQEKPFFESSTLWGMCEGTLRVQCEGRSVYSVRGGDRGEYAITHGFTLQHFSYQVSYRNAL